MMQKQTFFITEFETFMKHQAVLRDVFQLYTK
jgi:hypothetical protein